MLTSAALAITGPTVDRTLIVAVGLLAAVAAFFVLRRSPKLAVGVWIVVLCFVPVWIGINIGFNGSYFLPAAAALALLVTVSLLPVTSFRFSLIDGLVLLLVVFSLTSLLAGNPTIALGFAFSLATYFVIGYVLGRVAPLRVDPSWIYSAVAVAFTVVSVLALIEFFFVWNPFVLIHANNSMFVTWGGLQERGGVLRAEGAFGHSIALGSSLAIAVPLTLASRFSLPVRAGMVLLMLGATVVTFSRIGMITGLLGLVLSIVFMRDAISRRSRIVLTTCIAIGCAVIFPLVSAVFDDAGTEASGSADYRGDLLSLVGSMNLVGVADSARRDSTGQVYFGNFRSIDSQLILTGLSNGLIALILIVVALVGGIVLVVSRRATPPTIAAVAQIPAFATVALITQYSVFVWFVIGLAASTQLALRGHGSDARGSDELTLGRHRPLEPRALAAATSGRRI